MALKTLYDAAYQARQDNLRTTNHAFWQAITTLANGTITGSSPSVTKEEKRTAGAIVAYFTNDSSRIGVGNGDGKIWDAIDGAVKGASYHTNTNGTKYTIGDPAYNANPDNAGNRNYTREHFLEFAIIYDKLKGLLDATKKQTFIDSLNYWADLCLYDDGKKLYNLDGTDPGNKKWGTRESDSDELIGHYFGIVVWALVSADDNSRSAEFLNANHQTPFSGGARIGGLDATAADETTWRNTIKKYCTIKSNGSWIESSQYDYGTLQLLVMGAEAVKTATGGAEHFPEITALYRKFADYTIGMTTPDRSSSYKWGDNDLEHRTALGSRRRPLSNILMGALKGVDDPFRQYLNHFQAQFTTTDLSWRDFTFGDPTHTSTSYTTGQNKGFLDLVMGQGAFHDDWSNTNGSSFFFQTIQNPEVDHQVDYLRTWDLYRKGRWAVSHIVTYDRTGSDDKLSLVANTMLLGGLPVMEEARKPVAGEVGTDFFYFCGITGGCRYKAGANAVPGRFVNEWTSSVIYLPSTNAATDVVLLFDRTNAEDPLTVTNGSNYNNGTGYLDQNKVNGADYRKQWYIHSPINPTIGANNVTWSNGGTTHDLLMSLPTAANRDVEANQILGSDFTSNPANYPLASELTGPGQYRIRIGEINNNRWDMFANAFQAHEGTAATLNFINVTDEAVGYHVVRASHNDYVVMVNAKPSRQGGTFNLPPTDTSGSYTPNLNGNVANLINENRKRIVGYAFAFTAVASTSKLILCDLDTSISWSITVDGVATTSTTSDQGVLQATVTGTGLHNITVNAGGTPPAPSDTTAPSVYISTPLTGTTANGTVAVTAVATDNTGVAGVQFLLNGLNLGVEDLSSSYDLAWNTLQFPNGTYSLQAQARDAAGNLGVSTAVTIVVNNNTAVAATNVISNVVSNAPGVYQVDTLQVGQLMYTDASHTFATIPSAFLGNEYIRTANADKNSTSADYLNFNLSQPATVVVIFNAVDPIPGWLATGWVLRTDTCSSVGDTISDPRKFYSKLYPAGLVTLGGKNVPPGAGTSSNYIVAVGLDYVEMTNPVMAQVVSGTITVSTIIRST